MLVVTSASPAMALKEPDDDDDADLNDFEFLSNLNPTTGMQPLN